MPAYFFSTPWARSLNITFNLIHSGHAQTFPRNYEHCDVQVTTERTLNFCLAFVIIYTVCVRICMCVCVCVCVDEGL